MVRAMDERFDKCIKDGKLTRVNADIDLMFKEMEAAESDLETAERSLSDGNPKWAIIQCYYSMFHTSKALVLSKGYREKSHACLSIALKALFIDAGMLEKKHFDRFRDCMAMREDADYGLVYSEASAKFALEWAKEFLAAADSIISKPE
jgi:uncharacterized protein (UPF0332 family)